MQWFSDLWIGNISEINVLSTWQSLPLVWINGQNCSITTILLQCVFPWNARSSAAKTQWKIGLAGEFSRRVDDLFIFGNLYFLKNDCFNNHLQGYVIWFHVHFWEIELSVPIGMSPHHEGWTYFAKGLQALNRNLVKIFFALICMLTIQSGHKFARATTAQLSWHVQNCGLIWSLFFI